MDAVPSSPGQFGQRLRRERDKAGRSLQQLSQATGVSKAYLVKLENETSNPSLQLMSRLAEALDITVADLVGGPRFSLDEDQLPISPQLRALADEDGLSSTELRTLASIRFRKGDEPRTAERWRYIHDSLRLSSGLDPRDDA